MGFNSFHLVSSIPTKPPVCPALKLIANPLILRNPIRLSSLLAISLEMEMFGIVCHLICTGKASAINRHPSNGSIE